MGIRKLKPTTPGQRHKVIGAFDKITASTPEKSLVVGKKSTGGRNNTGKMTMRYLGGGHKQKYRFIDFKRNKDGIPATVKSIEYDPNRTSRIALLYYADGAKSYIIAPNGLEVGQTVVSGSEAAPEVGNTLPMANIPVGTIIHNIELRPGQGAKLVRSAGAFAHKGDDRQGNRQMGRVGDAAAGLHEAEGLTLLLGGGQAADPLDQGGPEGEEGGKAPHQVDHQQHGIVGGEQVTEAGHARQDQGDGDQLLRGNKVGHHAAEQVRNHAEHTEHGAKCTHLGVGQVIRLKIRVIVIGPEIGQAVDQGAGHRQDDQTPHVPP